MEKVPYCPNSHCPCHDPKVAENNKFRSYGMRKIKRYPYISPRVQCQLCKSVFSTSFFSLSYRDRTSDTYELIFLLRHKGDAKRGIAKSLNCSLDTVLRRIKKMSRHSLLRMSKDTEGLNIKESIAYDGLENFSFSQYDPNNINHAIGRESLFMYDFNFCHINRKGKMSSEQKQKKKMLDDKHKKYPPRAIETCSKRIFERLLTKCDQSLHLHTDNHFMYRNAIANIKSQKKIAHFITPAKVARNYKNRLFAINHMDLLTRHHLCDFKRETIAFAKTSQAMVESFVLFSAYKNYMREKFTKKQKGDITANIISPAMHLGLVGKILNFREFFHTRISKYHVKLNEDWKMYFEGVDPFSRRKIRPYTGI